MFRITVPSPVSFGFFPGPNIRNPDTVLRAEHNQMIQPVLQHEVPSHTERALIAAMFYSMLWVSILVTCWVMSLAARWVVPDIQGRRRWGL